MLPKDHICSTLCDHTHTHDEFLGPGTNEMQIIPTEVAELRKLVFDQGVVIQLGSQREASQLLALRKAVAIIDRLKMKGTGSWNQEDQKKLEELRRIAVGEGY